MLAALGEGALAAAGTVGAATGGLAVAGAGAALVGTAWAIEGGLNAASHLMGWGAATGGGTDSDASRPSMTTDVQTLNNMQSGAVDHYFIQEQRRAQRPEVFRIDTESESEPRNRPLPQIRSRPAWRPRPQAQTPFGLNNVPIPVSSDSDRSRISRQSRGDRGRNAAVLRGASSGERTGSCIGIEREMEQVTQAVNDELVASLDYKLATGNTNYIQSRKSVQYFPSSLSTFTPTTSRVCRIPITSGMDFLDPESVKLAFTFRNTDGSSDMLCGSPDPSCFIERIQLFANGQRVEDISYYGRSAFMYSLLKNEEWWKGRLWEGLPVDAGGWALPVQPGQKRDVLMAPHLIGMLNCGKMLPPQINLVLEIEFAEPAMAMRAGVGSSLSYQIENVHLLADQVTLDSALRESFERILLSNRSLVFSFPSLHVQQSSIPAGATSYNITVARAFTKLLGAFVTFNKTGENHVSNFEYPGEAFPNVTAATVMEGQLQLGALQFPRNSVKSIAEYHHFLEIMAGTYDSRVRNMRLPNFDNTDFIAAFPTERVPKHPTSGISTRSGDLCRFTFKSMLADRVDQCFIGLVSMQIVTLSGSGVSVLD